MIIGTSISTERKEPPELEALRMASAGPKAITPPKKTVIATKSIFQDLLVGLKSSRVLRATILSGASAASLLLLGSTPAGWAIAAISIGAFLIGLVTHAIFDKSTNKISFEITAIMRLLKGINGNFNEIPTEGYNTLYLGTIPNRLNGVVEHLKKNNQKLTILSINEDWEREPLGLSLPYSKEELENLEVEFKSIDVPDHTYLSFEQLDEAAEIINDKLMEGDVYVHCRAGKGRSAMAVAAYLMKHDKHMNANEAAKHIKKNRPISSILKKVNDNNGQKGLQAYHGAVLEKSRSGSFED